MAIFTLGKTADWVAPGEDAVWVGSTGPDAVHRVDPRSNRITDRIDLPGEPCAGLALGFGSLWVPLCPRTPGKHTTLARIDLGRRCLVAEYPTGVAAEEGGIAVSGDSVWLVTDARGSLARLDPATGHVRATLRIPPGSFNPHDVGGAVWVSQADGTHVTRVDSVTAEISAPLTVGDHPRFLTSGAGAVWVLLQADGRVARIDLETPRSRAHPAGHAGSWGRYRLCGRPRLEHHAQDPAVRDRCRLAPAALPVARRRWRFAGGEIRVHLADGLPRRHAVAP